MASTFTTNFGFEEIATGEQSGTWGTTTNFNFDILDRIASYGSVALSGTTHTLTVREASPDQGTENLQDGMYRVIKFTGALGANNTVTVAPNTSAAFFIFTNSTTDSGSSGPYSVIISQGSGANITITNGASAIVYCDGAGSGAAVVNALLNPVFGKVSVNADTAAGDDATMGYTAAEGLILTGQGSTNDITIKNDADAAVLVIPTGATNVDIVGDATAATFKPDGDTSASDTAAIGYTSAEGLILTGQGSTNDVTIKNDADADVLTIATGATNVDIVGDVTASTVNADGDTSAADNAAMGYTAAEGLILTGQGSTNDVTIKNDADAAVIKIATGGTNVEIVGGLTLGTDLSVANGGTGASTLTANYVLLGNGTSAPQMIAPGADGQVLTSTGSTWQSEAAAAGDWALIASATASDDAAVTFSSGITNAYSKIMIVINNLVPETDGTKLWMRMGPSGGLKTGASDYAWACHRVLAGGGEHHNDDAADDHIQLQTSDVLGNAGDENGSWCVEIFNPGDAFKHFVWWSGGYNRDDGDTNIIYGGGQYLAAAEAITQVSFFINSDNIASGDFRLYGLKDS